MNAARAARPLPFAVLLRLGLVRFGLVRFGLVRFGLVLLVLAGATLGAIAGALPGAAPARAEDPPPAAPDPDASPGTPPDVPPNVPSSVPPIVPPNIPPNVIVILADDLGYAGIGVQGSTDIPTPNVDRIAAEGVRFTSGYVSCPVCSPTRAGLLTGRYGPRFGYEFNPGPAARAAADVGLPREEATLAERLKAAGYATGMVGKWHLGFAEGLRPPERGFDSFFGFLGGARTYDPGKERADPLLRGLEPVRETEYLTTAFGREAVAFIDQHAAGPFFLYLAFNAVHSPMEPPTGGLDRFPGIADPRRRTHAAMLTAMDDAIGQVLDALRRHGLDEKTLLFFLSDNGGPTRQTTSRNDPLRGYKGEVHEGGIRVPFLVRWHGQVPAGKVDDRPVIALDIVPTALAAAGVAAPAAPALDGVDLLPYLRGSAQGLPHDALFWRFGAQSAARVGDWKLVVRNGGAEIYDLAADLGELQDLAASEPGKLAELTRAWAAWDAGNVPARFARSDRSRAARPGEAARRGGRRAAGKAPPSPTIPAPSRATPPSPAPPPSPGPAPEAGSAPQPSAPSPDPGEAIAERLLAALDRDGDRRLSEGEVGSPDLLRRMDADADGFATAAEIRVFFAPPVPPPAAPPVPAPPPPGAPEDPPR